jgi:signal transduction histidine kinase
MLPWAQTPAWPSTETSEQRAVAALRLVLASAALAVVWIDPIQPARFASATYAVLTLYTAYSAALYASSLRAGSSIRRGRHWLHWIDVGWYLVLTGLSGGASSLFFVLFFFPILVASFRTGFAAGMATTLGSALGVTTVGLLVAGPEPEFELNRLLLRPVSLGVIGFVIAWRGGFETLLQRRLALLKEIGRLSNPRFGTDRTIAESLDRLREFYDADDCLLLLADGDAADVRLRRSTRGDPARARREDALPPELARRLLSLSAEHALVYSPPSRFAPWRTPSHQYDVARAAPVAVDREAEAELAAWFAPSAFLTVPVVGRTRVIGRLYLACARRLGPADVEFLLQVVDCLLPLIENIRLIDRLAASAAEDERQKIARDVHDSIIQPYIGLQIGLSALRQQASGADDGAGRETEAVLAGLRNGIVRLLTLTEGGIADLRGFVARLKSGGPTGSGFAAIVQSYARRFSELTGIAVQVEVEGARELDRNDRLSAEVFHMIAEGLSNVRRHSEGKRALVRLAQTERELTLCVENEGDGRPPAPFVPRSIVERARSLQGWTAVTDRPDGGSRVTVTIPL